MNPPFTYIEKYHLKNYTFIEQEIRVLVKTHQ